YNVGVLFVFRAEDGIRYRNVTGVQTCALPIYAMGLEYVNQKKHEQLKLYHSKENIKKLRLDELFGDFYEEHIGMPLNEEHQTAVMQVLEEVRKEGNTK